LPPAFFEVARALVCDEREESRKVSWDQQFAEGQRAFWIVVQKLGLDLWLRPAVPRPALRQSLGVLEGTANEEARLGQRFEVCLGGLIHRRARFPEVKSGSHRHHSAGLARGAFADGADLPIGPRTLNQPRVAHLSKAWEVAGDPDLLRERSESLGEMFPLPCRHPRRDRPALRIESDSLVPRFLIQQDSPPVGLVEPLLILQDRNVGPLSATPHPRPLSSTGRLLERSSAARNPSTTL
jgi:hypothetical protein